MNKVTLESKVMDFIQRYSLIAPEDTVVVAVSGGADSVCLFHVLVKWQKALGIRLHVAHLNHQLRGVESETDAGYVSNLADSLGTPITIGRQDVAAYRTKRNCSVEEAARELRYAFLGRVAKKVGADRIATGHTRDDQVETILMHLLRGTGITGLCGLAPCSPMGYDSQETSSRACPTPLPVSHRSLQAKGSNLSVVRPLLDITREETTGYCQEHQLAPRIDSSNLSLSFFRNRLRLQLLPLLRQYNPSVDQALLRLADIAREDNALIEQQASELWEEMARQENNATYLDRKQLTSLPIALQRQLLRIAVTELAGDARDIEARHIEAARSLLNKPVGKRICLPHGFMCQGGYNEIVIASPSLPVIPTLNEVKGKNLQTPRVNSAWQSQFPPCPFPPLPGEFPLKVPGETVLSGWKVTASVVEERVGEGHCGHPKGARQSVEIAEPVPSASEESRRRIASTPRNDSEESRPAQGKLPEAISADFDFHSAGTEFFVRQRQPGDRFQPLGMSMPKKLYEFMVDAKVPRSWRRHIPIVCSPQQIIWVVGWRIDDRVKVTEASKEILRLQFIKSP
jgi:tRNA(Ile)-lysidine synthase